MEPELWFVEGHSARELGGPKVRRVPFNEAVERMRPLLDLSKSTLRRYAEQPEVWAEALLDAAIGGTL